MTTEEIIEFKPAMFKLEHFFKLLGSRIIPTILYSYNSTTKRKFIQWQGNACLQTAYISTWLLCDLLSEYEPLKKISGSNNFFSYDFHIYEGQFEEAEVHYNHAWCYAKQMIPGKIPFNILIDVARITNPNIVLMGPNIPEEASFLKPKYTLLSKKEHLIIDLDKAPEYYTGLEGNALVKHVKKELFLYNLDPEILACFR